MHVHSAPDIRERAYTDFELMEAGIRVGAKGIVLKSHHGSTVERAFLVNEHNKIINNGMNNDFVMYGSITLNYGVGGLNPIAVETALKMGAKVVWLPTIHASNQIYKNGQVGGIQCVNQEGNVVENLVDILELIKKYNVVLGTGHLSPQEIFVVVKKAREIGVEKIVITHPEFWVVGMSSEEQERIVKEYDVILERCYAQPMGGGVYKSNLADNLEIIKRVGYKNVMVDTDGGQIENPNWEIALEQYMQFLLDNGVEEDKLNYMTKQIPAKLLGRSESI
ncbi:hypothetical protein AN639_07660 [Candidatus Epulonipiscium fishelsonii]|uniref:Uncharacterized protein n=1 Tax=Candidatus Epulonipiscium fishelsonii TaxID=77094 RepID=A0ACC8XC16_9FIRM|nr:hypothetical protein AN639_07660 [Epulopiscium sp. SCG-B05WGA-EpuloA1]ONI39867.1 hypothetical protein AN396_06980 [Epulopiscium sp. SCG-B11WGA-EpuloA1]